MYIDIKGYGPHTILGSNKTKFGCFRNINFPFVVSNRLEEYSVVVSELLALESRLVHCSWPEIPSSCARQNMCPSDVI